jgi:hypothetical protein
MASLKTSTFVWVFIILSGYIHPNCLCIGWPHESSFPWQRCRGETSGWAPSTQKHCGWCRCEGILYQINHTFTGMGWRDSGPGFEKETSMSSLSCLPRQTSFFCMLVDIPPFASLAKEDICAKQYIHSEWRSAAQGVLSYPTWGDRKLHRAKIVKYRLPEQPVCRWGPTDAAIRVYYSGY